MGAVVCESDYAYESTGLICVISHETTTGLQADVHLNSDVNTAREHH